MEHPSHAKVLFASTLAIVIAIYTVFGATGYLVYGDAVEGSITLNLTGNGVASVM